MPAAVRCPACQKSLSVPSKYLGQTVSCPTCNAPFFAARRDNGIPAENSPSPIFAANSAVVTPPSAPAIDTVTCPHCRKLMADDGNLAGQLVQCPHCGGQLLMRAAARTDTTLSETTLPFQDAPAISGIASVVQARSDRANGVLRPLWQWWLGLALAPAAVLIAAGFLLPRHKIAQPAAQPKQPTHEAEAETNAPKPARSTAKAKPRRINSQDDTPTGNKQLGQPNALPHWTLYPSESGGFEVLLPNQKVEKFETTTCLGQKMQQYRINATSDISIEITWFDLPAEAVQDKPSRTLLDQIVREDFPATSSSASKRDMIIGDNPGVEYLLWEKIAAGGLGKARFFLVGRRVFALYADCLVDRIKRDAQVDGFLNSFRLYKQPDGTSDQYAVAVQEWQWANLWPIHSKQLGGAFVVSSSQFRVQAADGLRIHFVVAFGLEPPKDRGRLMTLITIFADRNSDKLQHGLVVLSLDANGEEITLVSEDKVKKDPSGRRLVDYTSMDPYEVVHLLQDVRRMTIKVAGNSPHQLNLQEIAHIRAFMQEVRDRAKEFGFGLSRR